MNVKHTIAILIASVIGLLTTACIEDGVSSSASDQPEFSTDTLRMGSLFTEEGSQTRVLKVYNRHNKIISISSIAFKEGSSGCFRLNVDGQSGKQFSGVEIRPSDSIFVLVDVILPANQQAAPVDVKEHLQFVTNGVTQQVVLTATGQDVERIRDYTVEQDETWSGEMPRQIFGTLTVAEGATLTLEAGSHLYFHDKSMLQVDGTLRSLGTAEAPVMLEGDRRGQVINGVGFEVMSRQWEGVTFGPTSTANVLTYTTVRNTRYGVEIADTPAEASYPALRLINCTLRNSAGTVLCARHSSVYATGCEFAEAGEGAVVLTGGRHIMNHCTFSNYYLFSAITGPLLRLNHTDDSNADSENAELPYAAVTVMNSIFYGSSADMFPGDLSATDVHIARCLIRSTGSDDMNFTDCLWGEDPRFLTRRDDYVFDYRPDAGSPVIGAADATLDRQWELQTVSPRDNNGVERPQPASIGAYEPRP